MTVPPDSIVSQNRAIVEFASLNRFFPSLVKRHPSTVNFFWPLLLRQAAFRFPSADIAPNIFQGSLLAVSNEAERCSLEAIYRLRPAWFCQQQARQLVSA